MFTKIFPKIHTEGYKFLVIAAFITIILLMINNFLGLIGLLLTIWVYYFFRSNSSTLASSGVIVAHLMPTPIFLMAFAESIVI